MSVDYDLLTRSARELTERDRRKISILLVEGDSSTRKSMRQALVSLGYDNITDSSDHLSALERMEEESFTHVIFEAKSSKISAREFLAHALEKQNGTVLLPSSYDPTIDDVFQLLIAGAQGYIVKPFTAGSLDESIAWATKGDPVTDAIRHTKGRNEALAAVILSALDRLALVMRQSRKFETAKLEIPRKWSHLNRAISLGRTFAKGGDPKLREAIVDLAIERSSTDNTRIGGTRARKKRSPDSESSS